MFTYQVGNATKNLPVMAKADADASDPAKCAEFVCDATVAQDAVGFAVGEKLITGVNTEFRFGRRCSSLSRYNGRGMGRCRLHQARALRFRKSV